MSGGSFAGTVGKGVIGAGVGFALYYLVLNLRLGGGLGFGAAFGVGEGRGGADSSPRPSRPRDAHRLNLLLSSRGFEWRDPDWKSPVPASVVTLSDAISRIREGGRSDVTFKTAGDVVQRDYEKALEGLKQAGIDVFKAEASTVPAPTISGNGRGEYGARARSWR